MRPPVEYQNFDIQIRQVDDAYNLQLLSSPAGEASAQFVVPFRELELENFILKLRPWRSGARGYNSPELALARDFGTRLFDAAFTGDVRDCFRSSLDQAKSVDCGLRIRLRLSDAPTLCEIPWEFLYSTTLRRFIGHSSDTPIVRYINLPYTVVAAPVTAPLRILVMISSPPEYPSLKSQVEWEKLRDSVSALERRGLVVLERTPVASLGALQDALRRSPCHIFHFIGHGKFDSALGNGVLVLEDSKGQARLVSGHDLGTILHDHTTMRLAVLNACEGARSSRLDPYAGVSQALLQRGVPAVIAMQFEVSDEAALVFSRELYKALAEEYPVDAALTETRKILFADGNGLEWATPVLYMRSPDGRIFDVAKPLPRPLKQYVGFVRDWGRGSIWFRLLQLLRASSPILLFAGLIFMMTQISYLIRVAEHSALQRIDERENFRRGVVDGEYGDAVARTDSAAYVASHARFSPVRFFESDGDMLTPKGGRYSNIFDSSKVRYIAWELGMRFSNPGPPNSADILIEATYELPSGETDEITSTCHLDRGQRETVCIGMAGWSHAGGWSKAGKYVVELKMGSTTIAKGSFAIYRPPLS